MSNLATIISTTKERKHKRRLKQLSDNTIKQFLEQQTSRRIRQIFSYKDEPLDNRFEEVPTPDIIAVYLADTFRLAIIEVKTSRYFRCMETLRD